MSDGERLSQAPIRPNTDGIGVLLPPSVPTIDGFGIFILNLEFFTRHLDKCISK